MKKRYLYVAALAALLNFSSCSNSFLDLNPDTAITANTFYKTAEHFDQALVASYTAFRSIAQTGIMMDEMRSDNSFYTFYSGDRGPYASTEVLALFLDSGDPISWIETRYKDNYTCIGRVNTILNRLESSEMTDSEKNAVKAEALFLRAYYYYDLVQHWGGVPLILEEVQNEADAFKAKSSAEEVYNQIITDLTEAISLGLPVPSNFPQSGRATMGAAKMLRAYAYMSQPDRTYPAAEQDLKDITKMNYTLLSDYGMNWRTEYENSSESVFEIANKVYDKNIATGTNVPHFFTSRRISGYQGYGFHVPTQDLHDAFDADDPRITYVFTQTGDRYKGDTEAQDNAESPSGYHDYKMTVPAVEKTGFDVWMISYNIRLIRYSDVLLMYAEVLNENGKPGLALPYLNDVRERARKTNPIDPRRDQQAYIPATTTNTLPDITETDQERLKEIIWKERRCELAMEGWRRDDLMRQKRFGTVMRAYATKYNTSKGANFRDDRDYLFPIPQGERDKSNNILSQKPGF